MHDACFVHWQSRNQRSGGAVRRIAANSLSPRVAEDDLLRLRADSHAQYEIRVYAEEICKIVADWVPAAYAAFEEHHLNATNLSGKALVCVFCMLGGDEVAQETFSMSRDEWHKFQATFKL